MNIQPLDDIIKVCTDNGWMYYFQANKVDAMGSVAEHQFIRQAVVAQRCDVLDWYCSNVEGLLFPWLWSFNKDTSLPESGLLHTTVYADEDTTDTNSNLYCKLNYRVCSLRSLASKLQLETVIKWIEKCKSSEKVEEYRFEKWFETTLLSYEGYPGSKVGFRGACHQLIVYSRQPGNSSLS